MYKRIGWYIYDIYLSTASLGVKTVLLFLFPEQALLLVDQHVDRTFFVAVAIFVSVVVENWASSLGSGCTIPVSRSSAPTVDDTIAKMAIAKNVRSHLAIYWETKYRKIRVYRNLYIKQGKLFATQWLQILKKKKSRVIRMFK